jgi:hypothetical protein
VDRSSGFIKLDDFQTVEVSGKTSGTADTKATFRNPAGVAPIFWFALEGDVYIPRRGLGPSELDVRSRLTSQEFRLLLVY